VNKEKKNKLKSWGLSLFFHLLLALIISFTIAWRKPYPPPPVFGIELSLGLSDQGDGETTPETTVDEISTSQEKVETEVVEPNQSENKNSDEPNPNQATTVVDESESIIDSKEQKENSNNEAKETPPKVETKPEKKLKAEYKNNDAKEDIKEEKPGADSNQGDKKNTVGDQGVKEGKLDSKGLYSGGGGMDLFMPGWVWEFTPSIPKIPDNENGKIVFEIECDENGEIIGIVTVERGLSSQAERLLKDEILRNSLRKKSEGNAPSRSKGRIVFILSNR